MSSGRTASLTTQPRRTLKAPAAALARVQKVLPPSPTVAVPCPVRQARDKPAIELERAAAGQAEDLRLDPELAARRKERNDRRNALFLKLREVSPALFAALPPPPMAIGIYDALAERLGLGPEGQADLRRIIADHVSRIGYQRALMAEGAVRLDVDGMPAGAVTAEHRLIAYQKIAKLKAKAEARKAAVAK